MNTVNVRFKKKLSEVYFIAPNDLEISFLTRLYKKITGPMKVAPFIFIIPFSFLLVFLIYFIFGILTVRLANLLQYGF